MKITLGGCAGTGTTTVGKLLAEKLHYPFMSGGGIFTEMAAKRSVTREALSEMAKIDPTVDEELDRSIKEYGQSHPNFVFESRLAFHFIPDSFKILLLCDFETRIARVAEREGVCLVEATENTRIRESNDNQRFTHLYGIEDCCDRLHFDYCIDTTNKSATEVAKELLNVILM